MIKINGLNRLHGFLSVWWPNSFICAILLINKNQQIKQITRFPFGVMAKQFYLCNLVDK